MNDNPNGSSCLCDPGVVGYQVYFAYPDGYNVSPFIAAHL